MSKKAKFAASLCLVCLSLHITSKVPFLSTRNSHAQPAVKIESSSTLNRGVNVALLGLETHSETIPTSHTLTLIIREANTDLPLTARVGVFEANGSPAPPTDRKAHVFQHRYFGKSYFYCEDSMSLFVEPGNVTIKAGLGFEYFPTDTMLTVTSDTTVVVTLSRFIDMESLGWYSADPHLHISHPPLVYILDGSHLRLVARGELLNFINSMDNSNYFTGTLDPHSEPNRLIYFSKEQRNSDFGHLAIIGLKQWIPDQGCGETTPPCGRTLNREVYEQVHSQSRDVAVIAVHPFPTLDITDLSPWPGGGVWRGMPIDLTYRSIDAMEILCLSHVLPPEGTRHYFQALNAGIRLAPSAGTDRCIGGGEAPPLGCYRVFVILDNETDFTLESWTAALRRGRSFVTNYPLITEFELDGAIPGDIIQHNGETLEGTLSVTCIEPIDTVKILANGTAIHTFIPGPGSERQFSTHFEINPTGLRWICAVVTGNASSWHLETANGMFALTGPIYLESDGWNCSDICRGGADFFLEMLGRVDSLFTDSGYFPDTSRVVFERAVAVAYDYLNGICCDPPYPFNLSSPYTTLGDQTVVTDPTPTFMWESTEDPDPCDALVNYSFCIDTRMDFSTAIVIPELRDTVYTLAPGLALEHGVSYYWRVEAFDRTGLSRLSTPEFHGLVYDSTLTSDRGDPPSPLWSLGPPQPNPFNPRVHISYSIPQGGLDHRLDIYDARGRRIRSLFNGRRGEGVYSVVWDGRSDTGAQAASGIYFVRLAPRGTDTITQKILMLR